MAALFQTAAGAWHWPSILMAIGWMISGVLIYFNLWVNLKERHKSHSKELQLRSEISTLDQHLLNEQRINAQARHRLNRVEDIALPRSISIEDKQSLIEELRRFEHINIACIDKVEPRFFALELMTLFKEAGCFGELIILDDKTRLGGVMIFIANESGDEIAKILFKNNVGGGSSKRFPLGFESVPSDRNCILVGDNMAAFGGGRGQDGEGLDPTGRPIPMPQ